MWVKTPNPYFSHSFICSHSKDGGRSSEASHICAKHYAHARYQMPSCNSTICRRELNETLFLYITPWPTIRRSPDNRDGVNYNNGALGCP